MMTGGGGHLSADLRDPWHVLSKAMLTAHMSKPERSQKKKVGFEQEEWEISKRRICPHLLSRNHPTL
jgi:hypothetical protein